MKKASIVFSYIATILGLIGVVVFTIYSFTYIIRAGGDLVIVVNGDPAPERASSDVIAMVMFLLLLAYFIFVTFTGLLTKNVVKDNRIDKIKPFGILSIIFFNPVGGIITIVYSNWLKKELERTAPQGKRKEATKKENE